MTPLAPCESFYVIVGSSAGGMTGLQFVVRALVADMPELRGSAQSTDAFGTPTIVHSGAVLLLSGLISAVAAASMTLLFIGIHDAWDSVTYLVFVRRRDQVSDSDPRG